MKASNLGTSKCKRAIVQRI